MTEEAGRTVPRPPERDEHSALVVLVRQALVRAGRTGAFAEIAGMTPGGIATFARIRVGDEG